MRIQSDKLARALYVLMGAFAACMGAVLAIGIFETHGGALMFMGLPFIGIGLATAIGLGRPRWIEVDNQSVAYTPAFGKTRTVPRSLIARIEQVSGGRGGSNYRFYDQSGTRIFDTDIGFNQADVEKLAKFLGVPTNWGDGKVDSSLLERLPPDARAKFERALAERRDKSD